MVARIVCRKLCGLVVALAATCTLAAAQTPNPIPGYLDPMTGIFTPLPPPPPPPLGGGTPIGPIEPIIRLTGTIVINVNATIVSPIMQGATLNGIGNVLVQNNTNQGTYRGGDGNQFTLTRSGSTATGSVTLPYNVQAVAGQTMKVQLTLYVSSASGPQPYIVLAQFIPMPTYGATTMVTFPVTM
jgi:hypothetical protein